MAKVVHLTTVHPPFDTRIFHKQAKTLVQAGYDVTLIAQHDRDEVVSGVRVLALPKPGNRLVRVFALTWRAFLLALRQKAAVYHFHDPELLPVGVLLKILTHRRVIYDVHEDVSRQIISKYWIPVFLRRSLALIFGLGEKLGAHVCDAVIVVTENLAEKLAPFGPVVIHNYPDLGVSPEDKPEPCEREEKVIIYVGAISRLRGAFEMIKALGYLSHVDNLCLELIGEFQPASLELELQGLPEYRRVRYLGWLRPERVYERLARATVGLVCLHPEPRYEVALPVKLFEYMAAGLPVIASSFPLWKEIVEGNGCGLTVNPLNPREIAEAVAYLLEHPDEAKQMGESGRRAVLERYNWENEGRKLLALYEQFLSTERNQQRPSQA